jgi:hypothetical protein
VLLGIAVEDSAALQLTSDLMHNRITTVSQPYHNRITIEIPAGF